MCQVVLFFVVFMCFHPFYFLTCQSIDSKLFTVLWVCFSCGRQVLEVNLLLILSSEWYLPCGAADVEIYKECRKRFTHYTIPLLRLFLSSVCCILVRCINLILVWDDLSSPSISPLSPYLHLSPCPDSQPLRVDVAVLSTSNRGQDLTFSL